MANFRAAVYHVLALEGGFSLHPDDRGNYNSRGHLVGTNRGISAPLMEDLLRMAPSRQDMQAITEEEAEAIYMVKFWIPIRGKQINEQRLANVLLDGAVNHGRGLGVRLMQRVLNVAQDGIVGPQTLSALNKHRNVDELVIDYLEARKVIYKGDSSSPSFLRGWLRRLENFMNPKNEQNV